MHAAIVAGFLVPERIRPLIPENSLLEFLLDTFRQEWTWFLVKASHHSDSRNNASPRRRLVEESVQRVVEVTPEDNNFPVDWHSVQ
jgi:hypothetical protein